MTKALIKLKMIIKKYKFLTNLENDINIYLKYQPLNIQRKFKKNKISVKHVNELLFSLKTVREILLYEIESLDDIEREVITTLCMQRKSPQLVSIECYVGLTTVYRIINNFALRLYYITLKNRDFEKSVNYVINQLKNNL